MATTGGVLRPDVEHLEQAGPERGAAMSRFGWPRPRAEGIADELTALQAAQRKEPGAAPDGLPPGVRAGGAFPTAADKGYAPSEVDSFLERAARASTEDIRTIAFSTVPKGGYDMDAVDTALDRLETDARRQGR
jgi:DivIVA domain-containing protein